MILIFQKIVSRLLLICDGCLLRRNCSIQWEDYKYDKINEGHYGALSNNYLVMLDSLFCLVERAFQDWFFSYCSHTYLFIHFSFLLCYLGLSYLMARISPLSIFDERYSFCLARIFHFLNFLLEKLWNVYAQHTHKIICIDNKPNHLYILGNWIPS